MSIELTCSSLYIAFRSNHPVLSAREWHRTMFSICLYICVLLRQGPPVYSSSLIWDLLTQPRAETTVCLFKHMCLYLVGCQETFVTFAVLQWWNSRWIEAYLNAGSINFQSVTITDLKKPPFCYVILILFTDTALLKKSGDFGPNRAHLMVAGVTGRKEQCVLVERIR